ncbi:ABC-three component system middle component 2 [Micromonospora sp. NPDC049102]|uniref:ABC-three component system middle component 2 n=1 Tax=Micromonospora sp. NPDC049102 TaxID=3364265 RepID=UPI00371EDA37
MNITGPLNSPLEAGLRVVFLLASGYPTSYGLEALMQLDHMLLHTGQNNGPPSIHPEVPGSVGELAVKRDLIKSGIDTMMRAGLVSAQPMLHGFEFRATENGFRFMSILDSSYARILRARAAWVHDATEGAEERDRAGVRDAVARWVLERDEARPEGE